MRAYWIRFMIAAALQPGMLDHPWSLVALGTYRFRLRQPSVIIASMGFQCMTQPSNRIVVVLPTATSYHENRTTSPLPTEHLLSVKRE